MAFPTFAASVPDKSPGPRTALTIARRMGLKPAATVESKECAATMFQPMFASPLTISSSREIWSKTLEISLR